MAASCDFYVQCPAELVLNSIDGSDKEISALDDSSSRGGRQLSQVYPPKAFLSIFLAGGISNCANWHDVIRAKLRMRCPELVLINPRRESFDTSRADETLYQIAWEHRHLRAADAILFWFPSETLCPITLYELGCWSVRRSDGTCERGPSKGMHTPLMVGCDPNYARIEDVRVQTKLERPEVNVVNSLDALADQVVVWYDAEMLRRQGLVSESTRRVATIAFPIIAGIATLLISAIGRR